MAEPKGGAEIWAAGDSRQGAKSLSLEKKDGNFSNDFYFSTPNFAVFAALREIFRDWVAAVPR